MSDIFNDIEIDQPVWLLLPSTWMQTFHIQNPHLSSQKMQNAHLIWEAQQRLSGEVINYRVLIPEDISTPEITINMVRDDAIDTYVKAAEAANLEIAGIGCEPEWDTEYNFEAPQDLRDALPADLLYAEDTVVNLIVSPVISISLAVVVLLIAVYIWLIPVEYTSAPVPMAFVKETEIIKKDTLTALVSETKDVTAAEIEKTEIIKKNTLTTLVSETEDVTEAEIEKTETKVEVIEQELSWFQKIFGSKDKVEESEKGDETVAEVKATSTTVVVADTLSPISMAVKILPTGAVIQLAVISPLECRLEISGIANPDAWTKEFRQATSYNKVSLIGKYTYEGKSTAVIRFPLSDFKPVKRSKDIDYWKGIAKKAGMNVKGRSASGGQSEALKLIESVWENPGGFEKVYLMSSNGHWIVTVQ
ncbi:MAG: hypothetical protein HQ568_05880 [Calditrichaeota bacterium]|nr:hypothetical protein [Calditrichota bacterium]